MWAGAPFIPLMNLPPSATFVSRSRPLVQGFFYNDPDYYPPIVNAIRLLCSAGFDVELFCRETGGARGVGYPPEAKILRLDSRGHGSWAEFFGYLRVAISRTRTDTRCFWGHDMHGFLTARLAAWWRRRPLVYHCHDYADSSCITAGQRIMHGFERSVASSADVVVVPDAARAEVIARELRLLRPPLIAANAPLFTPLVRRHSLHKALHSRGFRFDKVVFRQGRIGQGHAIEVTLRSMTEWQCREWGFVVMGLSDEAYLKSLNELARELGVTDRFVALPPVPYDQILHFTPDADVGHALYERIHVNNVHIGTASNKVMEYLAAGVPLLVSPNATLQRLVGEKECGVCADETDPASIARSINFLLSDEGRRVEMGRAARTAFEVDYSYDRQFAPVLERMRALTTCQPAAS